MNTRDKNIVLIGMPGCGKTSLGMLLAQMLGRKLTDIDLCIEEQAGYLREGARILGERADDHGPQATVSPGYDDLRWFELPAASMS